MNDLQSRLQAAVGDTYRIEKELGGGGMSRVFRAQEVRLGRSVVIKVLPPEMAAGVSVERSEAPPFRFGLILRFFSSSHPYPICTESVMRFAAAILVASLSFPASLGAQGASEVCATLGKLNVG